MNNMISKIKNSEFLTFGELLKLKVSLVLLFLFIFGVLTIPVSIFEEFSLEVQIIVPSTFIVMFLLSVLLLALNKVRVAMHFSIHTFIGLTVYYVVGSNHLYGYLLIFITLTIIIFYQDIYTYILYGGSLTIYGIYYIEANGELLMGHMATSVGLSSLVYQGILLGFFVIFLIHFILSDSMYESINLEYIKTLNATKKYQEHCLQYMRTLEEEKNKKALYDDASVQSAVSELSCFFDKFLQDEPLAIQEVVEFYFFLHHQEIDQILAGETKNQLVNKYTKELKSFLLNKPSEMNSILFAFASQFKAGYNDKNETRYVYNIDKLFTSRTNRLIALAFIYKYLKSEKTQYDRWGRIEKRMAHNEIREWFESLEFREIISFEEMTFFIENQDLFDKYFN